MSWMVDSELAEENLMPLILLLLGLFSATTSAEQQWFDRHSEGWFWYESIPESEEKPQSHRVIDTTSQAPSTRWIRQNIGQFLDKAIDDPSRENVSAYLYLNKIVKEKAERFALAGKQAIEGDPYLDENVRRPISPAAAKLKDDIAFKAKESILAKIANMAGLVFYYRGSCQLCQFQAKTVQLLHMKYGFEIIPISTDGNIIHELPISRIDLSPSENLNILTYPALFLMKPPDNIQLIRQGAISFTEMVDRLIDVAYEHQWIDEQEYSGTKISQASAMPSSHSLNKGLPDVISKVLNYAR